MSKAEDRALERFPVHEGASKEWIEMHLKGVCAEYIEGYQQAEKDLALTVEDVRAIYFLVDEVVNEPVCRVTPKEVYQEVLKRFLETKTND